MVFSGMVRGLFEDDSRYGSKEDCGKFRVVQGRIRGKYWKGDFQSYKHARRSAGFQKHLNRIELVAYLSALRCCTAEVAQWRVVA